MSFQWEPFVCLFAGAPEMGLLLLGQLSLYLLLLGWELTAAFSNFFRF